MVVSVLSRMPLCVRSVRGRVGYAWIKAGGVALFACRAWGCDGLAGANDGLAGTNDGLVGTNDGLAAANDKRIRTTHRPKR